MILKKHTAIKPIKQLNKTLGQLQQQNAEKQAPASESTAPYGPIKSWDVENLCGKVTLFYLQIKESICRSEEVAFLPREFRLTPCKLLNVLIWFVITDCNVLLSPTYLFFTYIYCPEFKKKGNFTKKTSRIYCAKILLSVHHQTWRFYPWGGGRHCGLRKSIWNVTRVLEFEFV